MAYCCGSYFRKISNCKLHMWCRGELGRLSDLNPEMTMMDVGGSIPQLELVTAIGL